MSLLLTGCGTSGFGWSDFPNLACRYDFTDLSTMYTSMGTSFDGTNYLEINSAAATGFDITMVAWVKSSTTAEQTAVWIGNKDSADEWVRIGLDSSGDAMLGRIASGGGEDVTTSSNIDDGNWHMIAAVLDAADDATLYCDAAAGVADATSVAIANFDRTTIGCVGASTRSAYNKGSIDNALIFNVALSALQIAYLYNSGSGKSYDQIVADYAASVANCPNPANIKGAWSLDEFNGTCMDASGNNLHLARGGVATAASFVAASTQYLRTATGAVTAFPLTMVTWLKTSTTAFQYAIATTNGSAAQAIAIGTDSGNRAMARVISGTSVLKQSSETNLNNNTWRMVAGNMTSSNVSVSVDGGNWQAAGSAPAFPTAPTETSVGTLIAASGHFNGSIDSPMIYKSTLTNANLTWLYNAGSGRSLYELKYSKHASNPGLPANYWTFSGEADGATATDRIGSLNLSDGNTVTRVTGKITERPLPVAGKVKEAAEVEDRALEFDGTDQSAQTNTAAISAVGSTLVAWVKSTTTSEQTAFWIGDKDADDVFVRIGIDGSGNAFLGRNASGGGEDQTSDANIDDGDWHLIVAVLTATADVDLYVDDGSAANDTTSVALTGFDRTSIGSHAGSTPATFFDGMIDEVMVFDSALDATDVSELYNSGAGITARDLIDGTVVLTSTKTPVHAWSLSKNNSGGAGEDLISTSSIDLTLTNSPTDAEGIPAGQTLNGLVSLVEDQAGSNDLTQATLSKRPEVVRVTDGTGYALYFDGTNDYLQTSAFSALSQPNTIMILTDITDTNADQGLVDGIAAGNEQSLQVNATGDLLRIDGGTAASTTIGADYGTLHAIVGVFNGASSVVYQDGGTGETESAGAETMTGVTVGTLQDGSSDPANMILRQLVVNDGALTTAQLNEIGGQWQTEHSITWTAIA